MSAPKANAAGLLPSLDGLRGLAALMVVASHASGLGLHLLPGLNLTGTGKYGVYLFFVLSAFLLTRQWLDAFHDNRVDLRFGLRYLGRRFVRIYPLYVLVLLAGWALAPRGLGVSLDGAAVWRHLSLQEGRDLYWSIPVEFLYYLCIPPIAWALHELRTLTRQLLGVAVLVLGLALMWPPASTPLNSDTLGYYLAVFVCGSMAAAWWVQRPASVVSQRRTGGSLIAEALVVLVLVASVPALWRWNGQHVSVDGLHRAFFAWGAFWALVLLGVASQFLPRLAWLFGTAPLRHFGQWCFSIYLLHMPALYVAKKLPMLPLFQAWAGLGLALCLAAAAHHAIERPALRATSRWLRQFG